MVLYSGAACCVSFTLRNSVYFIFGFSAANLGDLLRGIILGGCFWFCYWVPIVALIYPPLEEGFPSLEVGCYYLAIVALSRILFFNYILGSLQPTSSWFPGMWDLLESRLALCFFLLLFP